MRHKRSISIKRLLGLPRHPKAMSPEDRLLYRTIKRQLSRLPHNQRADFVEGLPGLVRRQKALLNMLRAAEAARNGAANPVQTTT